MQAKLVQMYNSQVQRNQNSWVFIVSYLY